MGTILNKKPQMLLEESGDYGEIFCALNTHLLSGGKKIRPQLCYLSAELFGLEKTYIKNIAHAAEYVHSAFLAHDDVIDNADMRRGKSSMNAALSNKKAVLAGDSLLAEATNLVVTYDNLAIYKDLSWVIQEAVSGEWMQLENIGNIKIEFETIEEIGFKKTGALIAWCMSSSAHLSNQSTEVIELCHKYARHIGIAFQLRDDILDFDAKNGKDLYKDIKEKIINAVSFYLLQKNLDFAKCFKDNSSFDPAKTYWTEDSLMHSIEMVENRAKAHIGEAKNCLEELEKLRAKNRPLKQLKEFTAMIFERKS